MTGTPRRRRWSAEEKASIVAESLARGAVARTVALRHGIHPNQLYAWRRKLVSGRADGGAGEGPGFVPVAVAATRVEATRPGGTVEIAVDSMIVRVAPGVDMGFLAAVLRAVRSA